MKDVLAEAEKLAGKDSIYRKRIQWQRDGFLDKFFISADGKRYGDYVRFCNNEEYKEFRTRKINLAQDGHAASLRAKKGIPHPVPVKLNSFQIYSSSPARDGKARSITFDYIRVCEK